MSDSSLRTEKREDGHKRAASITTRSRWSAPSCATATSRRYRKSSAPFAARELSPTTAAASTSKTLRTLSNIVASKEDLLYRALGVGRSRVEPQVREPHAVEALPAERGDLGVQALSQARDLGLRHGRHDEAPATSSTLRVEMPSTYISATAATSARSARQ